MTSVALILCVDVHTSLPCPHASTWAWPIPLWVWTS